MPYDIVKTIRGYGVKNIRTGEMKSSNTTYEKAKAQKRLLQGVEHGMKLNRK